MKMKNYDITVDYDVNRLHKRLVRKTGFGF